MLKGSKIVLLFLVLACMWSCGESPEEQQRISRAERQRLAREDSLALKVATLPTLDCMPLFVALESKVFEAQKVDVHLRFYNAHMDVDASLKAGHIEGGVTDLVRAQRMKRQGFPLRYVTATNLYWQLVSNRMARITELKQMEDKMMAMTRYSATDMLRQMAVDSVRLKSEYVFPVQINDVNIRLRMLLNNEMDAMFLPEPQATTARLYKHPVLMDSRNKDMRMGVIAFSEKALRDSRRQKQLSAFIDAYNIACDSLNQRGLQHYAPVIKKYTKVDDKTIKALPKTRFEHAQAPRQKDIDRASAWLGK